MEYIKEIPLCNIYWREELIHLKAFGIELNLKMSFHHNKWQDVDYFPGTNNSGGENSVPRITQLL